MQRKTLSFIAAVVLSSAAFLSVNAAYATPILYTISSSATDPSAGPGELYPGTLTGTFWYDPTTQAFSSASLGIEGVQSCNLNGNYDFYGGNSSNLQIRGITSTNACSQSNSNSYLDIVFNSSLGSSGGDQIVQIYALMGNPANFTLPPTVAYADPSATVPEPSSLALLGSALALLASGFALRRRTSRQRA
jgi:hypothetical protein